MTGYGGRTLHVDLTSGRTEVRPLDERTARAFLGGNGLAARLLWEAAVPGTDPFDPAQPRRPRGGPDHRHPRARQQPRVRRHQVAPDGPVLRLDVRRPVPGHAQAHRLRRRRGDRARRPSGLPRGGRGGGDRPGRARRLGEDHPRHRGGDPGRRRRRDRRAGHRPRRRAPRALRVPRPLLEEPRGRRRPRGHRGRVGRQAPEGRHRPGEPEDRRSPIPRGSSSWSTRRASP